MWSEYTVGLRTHVIGHFQSSRTPQTTFSLLFAESMLLLLGRRHAKGAPVLSHMIWGPCSGPPLMYSSPWDKESTESGDVIFGDPWSHLTPHCWYQNLLIAVQMAPGLLLGSVCLLPGDKEQCSVPLRLPKMGFTCREETMDGAWTVGLDVQSPVQSPLWWVVFWSKGRKRRGAGWGQGVGNEVTAPGAAKFGTLRGWRNLKQNLTLPAIIKHTC